MPSDRLGGTRPQEGLEADKTPATPRSTHTDASDDTDHFSDASEGRGEDDLDLQEDGAREVDMELRRSLDTLKLRNGSQSPIKLYEEHTIIDEEKLGENDSTLDEKEAVTSLTNPPPSYDYDEDVDGETEEQHDAEEEEPLPTQSANHLKISGSFPEDHAQPESPSTEDENEDADADADGFGDDFDDFEEGQDGEDFGDFGDFGAVETPKEPIAEAPTQQESVPYIPVLDFEALKAEDDTGEALRTAVAKAFANIFPPAATGLERPPPTASSMFQTERSMSLWTQLSAPPPLQPPNWTRSRIRRLFLVSLGVPVDLDEILPASKQKKLVLPSSSMRSRSPGGSMKPRPSTDSTSSASSSRARGGKKKKLPGPPFMDMGEARTLSSTSDVRLQSMSADELQSHVKRLEEIKIVASEVLTYWLQRREAAESEKTTFESVIESLVGYAKKQRKK